MDRTRDAALTELLAEVRRIEIQSRRLVTDVMSGGYRSVFRGSGIEFDEVREYAEGDDPRAMDWGVSARMGRPFVRKYAEERELSVIFLLDLAPTLDAGFGAWTLRQTAARFIACLALAAVRNGDKVGLIAGSRFVPPRKGLRHAVSIVRDGLARPCEEEAGPAPLLASAGRALHRRAVLFLLSDFLTPGAWESPLLACARRHDLVAVRLIGAEWEAPRAGRMRLRAADGARHREVDWSHADARRTYSERVHAWSASVQASLRRARVDGLDLRVPLEPDPATIAQPILSFFRARELRGGR
jgi:uncharacterized protein (DUF58 family)